MIFVFIINKLMIKRQDYSQDTLVLTAVAMQR
jgi:hypothetical protein